MADVLAPEEVMSIVRDAPTRVAVFAYGTLRPGQPLARNVNVVDAEPGKIHGHSLYRVPNGAYPHMVRERGGKVQGDLLWVTPDARLLETVRMEMRVGYEVRIVNVYSSGMEEPTPALGFVYPRVPFRAERIETGDWTDVEVSWGRVFGLS